jgi:hypothetical protein
MSRWSEAALAVEQCAATVPKVPNVPKYSATPSFGTFGTYGTQRQ